MLHRVRTHYTENMEPYLVPFPTPSSEPSYAGSVESEDTRIGGVQATPESSVTGALHQVRKPLVKDVGSCPEEALRPSACPSSQPRFARLELLSPFIPKADPDRRSRSSWWTRRTTVLGQASFTAGAVFLINLIAVICFVSRFQNGVIFQGSCHKAAELNTAIHFVLNALSTLLMGASNFSMQLLAAPTRGKVDKAHSRSVWLDIGVPSLRNITYISGRRRLVWWILGLSSLPLHFLYNSAIFTTTPSNDLQYIVITPGFLQGGPVNVTEATNTAMGRRNLTMEAVLQTNTDSLQWLQVGGMWGEGHSSISFDFDVAKTCGDDDCSGWQAEVANGTFTRNVTALQCLEENLSAFSNRSRTILVASIDLAEPQNNLDLVNNTLLFAGSMGAQVQVQGQFWPCGSTNTFDCRKPEDWIKSPSEVENWNVIGYKIDHCIIRETNIEEFCSVRYSLPLMIMVCIANFCKCVCILYTIVLSRRKSHQLLATVGDAIVSFLTSADATTTAMCLANKSNFSNHDRSPKETGNSKRQCLGTSTKKAKTLVETQTNSSWLILESLKWQPGRPRWFEAASRRRWYAAIAPYIFLILAGIGSLILALETLEVNAGSMQVFAHLGFGSVNEYGRGSLGLGVPSLANWPMLKFFICVIFANVWQFAASMLYVQSNALFSCIFANREWHHYALERKPLRVTEPHGLQRSSYYISMPWRFGIPLMSSSAILHWTLSQSVFVMVVEAVAEDGTIDHQNPEYFTGFSVWPIIVSILIFAIFGIALVLCGIPHYQGGIPMGATCSAVISAACHQPLPGDIEAYKFAVQWGAVSQPTLKLIRRPKSNINSENITVDGVSTGSSETLLSEGVDEEGFTSFGIEPGHCCFTTARDVEPPREGQLYA